MKKQNHNTVNKSKARDMLRELKEAKNVASAAKEAQETLQMENKILKQNVEELKMKLCERGKPVSEESVGENEDISSRNGSEGLDSSANTVPTEDGSQKEDEVGTRTLQRHQHISGDMVSVGVQTQNSNKEAIPVKVEQLQELSGTSLKNQEHMSASHCEKSSKVSGGAETPKIFAQANALGIANHVNEIDTDEETSQHCSTETNKAYNQKSKGTKSKHRSDGKIVAFGGGFAAGITISLLRAIALGLRRRN